MIFKTVFALAALSVQVSGLPGGSPYCDSTLISGAFTKKHGTQSTAVNYKITGSTATFTPGTAMTITVSGDNIGGALFGVKDAAGAFVAGMAVPAAGSFKMCSNGGAGSAMTVTHTGLNAMASVDIPFTPPMGVAGPLTVSAIVTSQGLGSPWNTATMTLNGAGAAAPAAPAPAATTPPPPVAPQPAPAASPPAPPAVAPPPAGGGPVAPAIYSPDPNGNKLTGNAPVPAAIASPEPGPPAAVPDPAGKVATPLATCPVGMVMACKPDQPAKAVATAQAKAQATTAVKNKQQNKLDAIKAKVEAEEAELKAKLGKNNRRSRH
ncbi:hypothetical protein SmJEL517_g06165 [Synchytrium microbalum]|uniref:Reelin domain-containing protein n=1 Tax=Synchytrium microbalum TaxID=1806994 RepID=A0A507BRU8_9FUNG|nr:uncharacterized protein SmJEL517_g06165 [Synchytrium microbalum]TPX30228.1 hypothetical protein SmJEL517_g06165 [Synchytrium microbalum]